MRVEREVNYMLALLVSFDLGDHAGDLLRETMLETCKVIKHVDQI